MEAVADGLWQLRGRPRHAINIYLAGDVLVDAGTRQAGKRILRQLRGRPVHAHALTHVHPDHQGCAKAVCEARGVPLACHAGDVDAMEGRRPVAATTNPGAKFFARMWEGPPHQVDRVLQEGDEVADFRLVHAPGHAPGEVIYFRESDRVAICGDVIRNCTYVTMRTKLAEPPDELTPDPVENRASIRKLAALNPSLILPGHGPAVTDIAAFERFASALPG